MKRTINIFKLRYFQSFPQSIIPELENQQQQIDPRLPSSRSGKGSTGALSKHGLNETDTLATGLHEGEGLYICVTSITCLLLALLRPYSNPASPYAPIFSMHLFLKSHYPPVTFPRLKSHISGTIWPTMMVHLSKCR